MLILISCSLFFAAALALLILQIVQPKAGYAWFAATGGATLALASVLLWKTQAPFDLTLPAWKPLSVFPTPLLFRADDKAFALALSVSALTLAILLTAITRSAIVNTLTWSGSLALGGMGLLAVSAGNPLTLLLVWSALDLIELAIQLPSAQGETGNEKIVISFSTRVMGSGLLLWANIVSAAQGNVFDFQSIAPQAGIYLVLAAGLRLGVLPLHLPYASETSLRRGIGTSLRLISAVSSLALLARAPAEGLQSAFTPFLMGLSVLAALYGGWMWLRAPDDLNGRPYWIICLAALAIISALSGNPLGVVAWGCALLLTGGALFLASAQHAWTERVLLVGTLSLSSAPFSLTASAWVGNLGFSIPFVIAAQALLMAGFLRQALRVNARSALELEAGWGVRMYAAGIALLGLFQLLLGLTGWAGAFQIGAWLQALITALLTAAAVWATPRLRLLNPVRAHWVQGSASSSLSAAYQGLWLLYRFIRQVSQAVIAALEGEGGMMWTLLLLILFISFITQGNP
ncbi:MAG: hypothetical protein LDL50_07510 [Chloroflexi bacterium]|nr:hypothetical protein [Chloroflexota bacterium]MCA2000753.1 hypothetical protein [Chloroflexota bacterium]